MTARFTVDDDEQSREFDRLLRMGPVVAELERLLSLQYSAGQAAVHVDTGSLKNSETIESEYTRGRWEGEISFGGASPGFPNDPVVYAVYEAARGGHHDFSLPITSRSPYYRRAMIDHLNGKTR